ncbi:MAG: ATP/GTP-binding protein [Oscillospiraceae bacterium]
MLCQFTFKNFKSYKNETVFDMQAVSSQGFVDSLLQSGDDSKTYLPVSVVYGPNAGGKSNLLDAFTCVNALVMTPVLILNNKQTNNLRVNITPFLFNDTSQNESTEFELYFRPNDEYEYKYFVKVFGGKIIEERLYRRKTKPKSRISMLFERDSDGIKLGSSINKASINKDVNDQMPYLSFLYINYKLEPIALAVSWFEKCIIRNYANPFAENRLIMGKGEAFKKKLISLMNDVGINISDFEFIEKSSDDNSVDIFFEHTVNGQKYKLNIMQESNGTQKLFNVLPLVIIALSEGRLLVFDELDAKLHPKMLKFIIMLFKNPEINTQNAQLLFTSHDISTMKSSVFRTDEIWFACKLDDESSDLYSLYEMRDESGNHIQASAAFDKQYLEGRYGADPYFQNMMEWK